MAAAIDFLDELLDYLDENGIGTVNTDIFMGKMPPNPSDCVVIKGNPTGRNTPASEIPIMEYPRFQILVRASNYGDGAAKLREVRTLLHGKLNFWLPHFRVLIIQCEQDGGPLGQDDQGRSEFSINFISEHHYGTPPTP